MKKIFLMASMIGVFALAACTPSQQVDFSAEETQLAEILSATLTAGAPTATLPATETPVPTETPQLVVQFLNPTSILETLYPESEGWGWKDSDASRLALFYNAENVHFMTLIYREDYFQMGGSASLGGWDSDYVYNIFTRILADFVTAGTQANIMENVRTQSELGTTETNIDGFRTVVTLQEEDDTRRVFVLVQQQGS